MQPPSPLRALLIIGIHLLPSLLGALAIGSLLCTPVFALCTKIVIADIMGYKGLPATEMLALYSFAAVVYFLGGLIILEKFDSRTNEMAFPKLNVVYYRVVGVLIFKSIVVWMR